MSDASKYAGFIAAGKHSKMILLSSFKAPPHLGQRLCLIFSLLSSAAFAQSPFVEITPKPAQVAVTTAHPRAKGQKVEVVPMNSGMGFLKRAGNGWIGSADPRRDGVAWGFNPRP